ncbi:MAG: hypothetical protein HC786_30100 [Richelia sp. CSU_2_1]|nr:hypothetical protein [Microcoleus sp. SU_5_6]NJR26057.1 hypothetical protein [Richelia sp. CSU_2_1]
MGPPPTPFHQVRHLNGDPTCNNLENIAWGTAKENAADKIRQGRRSGRLSKFKFQDLEEMQNLACSGVPTKKIAERFQISRSYCSILIRRIRQHLPSASAS